MAATTQDLYEWLRRRYSDYQVKPEPMHGTYGLIWFLDGESGSFAVKTIAPERLLEPESQLDGDYLQREFRMWLELPHTYNVLPALGFDVATIGIYEIGLPVKLPVMRMPRRLGSLQDWVGSTLYSYEARLVALAQAFNGLIFLYEHGIQGHGDLKPSNILYGDLHSFALPHDGPWPSRRCPWQIQIADLGWADAWVDLGFAKKAFRQYLAPERFDDIVTPMQSDVYSMGIIATEILQGRHPAGNLKRLNSEGKWMRWLAHPTWELDGVSSPRIKSLILKCLEREPNDRPSPYACLSEVCQEIEQVCGYSIEATLGWWRRPAAGQSAIAADEQTAWAAEQSAKLNFTQQNVSRQKIRDQLNSVCVVDFGSSERWLVLAEVLEKLLSIDQDARNEIDDLRKQAYHFLVDVLGKITLLDMNVVKGREDQPAFVRPFERFAVVAMGLVKLAGITYEQATAHGEVLGDYLLGALAFQAASQARRSSDHEMCEHHLATAIALAPQESVPYYFRASWRHERALMKFCLSDESAADSDRQLWKADLEMALTYDPDWTEPQKLLDEVQGNADFS